MSWTRLSTYAQVQSPNPVHPRMHAPSYYRKRGSATYIVREVRSVRERDTERESETEVTSPK